MENSISCTSSEDKLTWECMPDCPTKVAFKIIPLNHFEFLVIDSSHKLKSNLLFYKYNIYSNQWVENRICLADFFESFTALTIDKQNNEVYLFSGTSLRKINVDNAITDNKIITIKEAHGIGDLGNEPSMIYINNDLHIIGGDTNKCHYIYHMETVEYELIHKFEEFSNGFSSHKLIFLQSIESILLMGGYDDHERGWRGGSVDTIYMYSMKERKWNKLNETLPVSLYRYAYILTNNDEFIILVGGNPSGATSNYIYILNVKEMKFYVSKIRFPESLGYSKVNAITVYHGKKDNYLACGYLRMICKLFNIHIPLDVIQLIELWIRQTYVYVISEAGKMWRIKLNELLLLDDIKLINGIGPVFEISTLDV